METHKRTGSGNKRLQKIVDAQEPYVQFHIARTGQPLQEPGERTEEEEEAYQKKMKEEWDKQVAYNEERQREERDKETQRQIEMGNLNVIRNL